MYANDGIRTLHEAVLANDLRRVTDTLAKGVTVDAADSLGVRPIHIAAERGHSDIRLLVAHGCGVNVQTPCPATSEQQQQVHIPGRCFFPDNASMTSSPDRECLPNPSNFGASPLHLAAQHGHLLVVITLFSANADVNAEDNAKKTPLFYAVEYSCEAVATFLIQMGALVNIRTVDGSTPLHCAASKGNVNVAKLLVQNNAEINAKSANGWTPLHASIVHKRPAVTQFLIVGGADVNAVDNDRRTPLFYVAKSGYTFEIARLLTANGANVNARDKAGRTPLHLAAENDCSIFLEHLLKNKADVNVADDLMWTPLHCAAYGDSFQTVNCLVQEVANVDARTLKRATPLHFAAGHRHVGVVKLLLANGADVNAADDVNWTALHYAADGRSSRRSWAHPGVRLQDLKLQTAEVLIENGADVNAKGSTGETALHVAVKYGDETVARHLLENGAYYDAETTTCFGSSTVLETSSITGNVGLNALLRATEKLFEVTGKAVYAEIEKCIQEGAPVNSRSTNYDNGTPLMNACWNGNLAVVRLLLANGADTNMSNHIGITPLHCAAHLGRHEILCALLQHGAIFNARTKTGKETPLYFAQKNGSILVADTLERIERMIIRVHMMDNTVLNELQTINRAEFLAIKNCRNLNKETLPEIASKMRFTSLSDFFHSF